MTAEELVIGYYEKSLTSEQELRLASMVDASPDVRSLFEQHGNIHTLMIEEAETIETSSKLDKVVIGAALGTFAEIAGHGIGFSLLGKVAGVVGALAVGGAGFVLYNAIIGDDEPQMSNPPVVRSAENPTLTDPSQVRTPTNASPSAIAPADSTSATSSTSAATSSTASARGGRSQTDRGQQNGRDGAGQAGTRPGVRLDQGKPDATVVHEPVTTPEPSK